MPESSAQPKHKDLSKKKNTTKKVTWLNQSIL